MTVPITTKKNNFFLVQSICRNLVYLKKPAWMQPTALLCCQTTIAVFVAALATSVSAQDVNWINQQGGDFNVGSNWSTGNQPSDTDAAVFDLDATYSIDLSGNETAAAYRQSRGNVSFTGGGQLRSFSNTTINGNLAFSGGTNLNSSHQMYVGDAGTGNVLISSGSRLSGFIGYLGNEVDAFGSVTVDGEQSSLSLHRFLTVGGNGTGELNIQNGGHASTGSLAGGSIVIGASAGSTGAVTLTGAGSYFGGQSDLTVGSFGIGTLNINDTGTARSLDSSIGSQSGSTGTVNVNDYGTWETTNLNMGINGGTGSLSVADTGRVWVGNDRVGINNHPYYPKIDIVVSGSGGSDGNMIVANESQVNGDIAIGNSSGNTGALLLTGGSVFNGDITLGYRDGSSGAVIIEGSGTEVNADVLRIGFIGEGDMTARNQAVVNSFAVSVGRTSYPTGETAASGVLTLQGHGTTFNTTAILIGDNSPNESGNVRVESGADMIAGRATLANGTLEISGSGSSWHTGQMANTASDGYLHLNGGDLLVENRALLTSKTAKITAGSTALVTGYESSWQNSDGYDIDFNGSLQIKTSGKVSVNGTTTIATGANVVVDSGGRFEFGTTDMDSYSQIGGSGGSLKGQVAKTGYTHIESLWEDYSKQNLNTTEVVAANYGVIYGSGVSQSQLVNLVGGEVRTLGNEWARFGGQGSTNAGEINNFGGVFEIENDLTNTNSGFIGGRGQFVIGNPLTSDGLTNAGRMAFTGGTADILGNVNNIDGGEIITSGYAITTFFDDVIHNGAELRTQAGSATVFLGGYGGAGSLTGTGDVFFEGEVNIGNSPAVIDVEGDLHFGSASSSLFEIAGLTWGEFDKFLIGGDLSIDGQLYVELLDGFQLDDGQVFLIAEVDGMNSGQFVGLDEGALIGNFSGRDLFISYRRGDGNDVALFSAVPEPGALILLGVIECVSFLRRRRTNVAC